MERARVRQHVYPEFTLTEIGVILSWTLVFPTNFSSLLCQLHPALCLGGRVTVDMITGVSYPPASGRMESLGARHRRRWKEGGRRGQGNFPHSLRMRLPQAGCIPLLKVTGPVQLPLPHSSMYPRSGDSSLARPLFGHGC